MLIPRSTKIFVTTLILAGILGGILTYPFISPSQDNIAQAGLLSCLGSGFLNFGIRLAFEWGFQQLRSYITSLTGFGAEVPVAEDANRIKEGYLDIAARCVARMQFDKSVAGILSIIRTQGREGTGEPLFVRNWRNFETKAQYRGEQLLRDIVAVSPICGYLQENIFRKFGITSAHRVSLNGLNIRVGNLNPFSLRSKCPLPSSFDLAAYEQDPVANGGWQAFERFLAPQGNPYMTESLVLSELKAQRAIAVSADLGEVGAGRGYESKRGSDVPGSGPPTGNICNGNNLCPAGQQCGNLFCNVSRTPCIVSADCPANEFCDGICFSITGTDPSCRNRGPNGDCDQFSDIRTPGSSLAGSVDASVQQEFAWVTAVDELEELIIAHIASRLTNRLMDLGSDEPPAEYASTNENLPTGPGGPGPPGPGPGPTPPPGGGCFNFPISCVRDTCDNHGGAVANAATIALQDPLLYDPVLNRILDNNGYLTAVVNALIAQGLRAQIEPGSGDEINVSVNGTNDDEHWDLIIGSNNAPWENCVGTWDPSPNPY